MTLMVPKNFLINILQAFVHCSKTSILSWCGSSSNFNSLSWIASWTWYCGPLFWPDIYFGVFVPISYIILCQSESPSSHVYILSINCKTFLHHVTNLSNIPNFKRAFCVQVRSISFDAFFWHDLELELFLADILNMHSNFKKLLQGVL